MISLLQTLSSRMGARSRRLLLLLASIGMGVFASSTASAMQQHDLPDTVSGAALLFGCTIFAALAWTVRNPVPVKRR